MTLHPSADRHEDQVYNFVEIIYENKSCTPLGAGGHINSCIELSPASATNVAAPA